ncbi:MAG: hypothetical protein GX587_06820 [Bacteroidales bacterium]|nr:hypothetical protein [Bacteroidales bacterium]
MKKEIEIEFSLNCKTSSMFSRKESGSIAKENKCYLMVFFISFIVPVLDFNDKFVRIKKS